jgi:hypothetical protein
MNIPTALLKLAGLIVLVGASPHSPAAVVEEVTGHSAAVQFMDYVEPGQIIRLGTQDKIVLGYLSSCWRETITGGTVTVGIERSDVAGGMVERSTIACQASEMHLTAELNKSAAMVFRDLANGRPEQARPLVTLYGRSPMIEVRPTGKLLIERIDNVDEHYEISLSNTPLIHDAFLDLADSGVVLTAGGSYRAKAGTQQIDFAIDSHAQVGHTPIVGRLLRLQPRN